MAEVVEDHVRTHLVDTEKYLTYLKPCGEASIRGSEGSS